MGFYRDDLAVSIDNNVQYTYSTKLKTFKIPN